MDLNGCWIWQLSLSRFGYARIIVREGGRKRLVGAHRYAYEALIGPVPDGLQLDHLCRVRACVFPEHMEPVTAGENLRRKPKPDARTHCRRRHEFTVANTRVGKDGGRRCRTCDHLRNKGRANPALAMSLRETGR